MTDMQLQLPSRQDMIARMVRLGRYVPPNRAIVARPPKPDAVTLYRTIVVIPLPEVGNKRDSARQIITQTGTEYGVTYRDIIGRGMSRIVVAARHDAIFRVAEAYPERSLTELAGVFGGCNHTTILNTLRKRVVETGKPIKGWTVEECAAKFAKACNQRRANASKSKAKFRTDAT
jgi:hypothetical protein